MSDVLEELRTRPIQLLKSLLPPAFVLIGNRIGDHDTKLSRRHCCEGGIGLVWSPVRIDADDQHPDRLSPAEHDHGQHESLVWGQRSQRSGPEDSRIALPQARHEHRAAAVFQHLQHGSVARRRLNQFAPGGCLLIEAITRRAAWSLIGEIAQVHRRKGHALAVFADYFDRGSAGGRQ